MEKAIFGTWQIAGVPSFKACHEKDALEILEQAYQSGIKTFDTAPIYGLGRSEKLLGKFLQGKREKIQIITKFGFNWGEDNNTYFDFSSDGIKRQLDESLKRLQTDYVDIYLLHVPQDTINIEDILITLNELKSSGKIKSYGVCNMYHQQLQSFLYHPISQAEYIQDFYNLIEKKAEKSIFPYLKQQHKFLAYSPLYRGVLTSKTLKQLLKKDEDAINMLIKNQDLPKIYKQKLLYQAVAQEKNISIEEVALNFLKQHPRVDNIIFGTSQLKHLELFTQIMQ